MPVWYWDKKELVKNSPSKRDGIDWEAESKFRLEGVRFIFGIGSSMKLPYETWATGAVYFHRFYVFKSFKNYDRFVVATACLFLAGKIEETPKKGKDLLKFVKDFFTASRTEEEFNVFGEDPKETLITMERIVLKTIRFDLQIEHPHFRLLKYLKEFKGSNEQKAPLAQAAWNHLNDSFCTTLCLQWEPDIIATSMLYLATKMPRPLTVELNNPPLGFDGKWWKIFVPDLNQSVLEDVCHQQLDFIAGNIGGSSSKKKKKKSSSSASSTPGPGSSDSPANIVPTSDKRKAPTTPHEMSSKKIKSDDTVQLSSPHQVPPKHPPYAPPPPPSAPPPPPPPPPGLHIASTMLSSHISVHRSLSSGHRPRSPDSGNFHGQQSFEGHPIPALGSVNGPPPVIAANPHLPHNYPAFSGSGNGSDSRSRSPSPSQLQPRRASYQNRRDVRDHRLPAQPQPQHHRSNSRERDRSTKNNQSFGSNNRNSRFDSKSTGSVSNLALNSSRMPPTPTQGMKPLLSPPGEHNTRNGDIQHSGNPGMFPSYAAAAAFGTQPAIPPGAMHVPTPLQNLVANLARTNIPGVPPAPNIQPLFPNIQSPPPYPPGNPQGPGGINRTPSNVYRGQQGSNYAASIPSLLPPR